MTWFTVVVLTVVILVLYPAKKTPKPRPMMNMISSVVKTATRIILLSLATAKYESEKWNIRIEYNYRGV